MHRGCRSAVIPLCMVFVSVAAVLSRPAWGGPVTQAILKCKEAKAAQERGETGEAIRLYTEAIELNPKYAEAYFERSRLYRQSGQSDKELEDLTSTLALDKKHYGALIRRADVHFYSRRYLDAELDYTVLIKLEPRYWRHHHMRGRARAAQGHLKSAIKDFDRAIEASYGAASPYYERGKAYLRLGNRRRAEKDFERAIKCDDDHVGAHIELGKLCLADGKHDKALKFFTTADRSCDGESGGCLFWRGNAYKALKKYEPALADYTGALEREFDTPQLRYNRAAVCYELGKLELARDDLKAAIAKDDANKQYAWALQRVEEALARKRAAEPAAGHVDATPDDADAETSTTPEEEAAEEGGEAEPDDQSGADDDEEEKEEGNDDDESADPL